MATRIYELWGAGDLPGPSRVIRIIPTIPEVCTVGSPQWEVVRYEVPARGPLSPLTFTWHSRTSHFIDKALGDCPEWRQMRPKPWWSHGGSERRSSKPI